VGNGNRSLPFLFSRGAGEVLTIVTREVRSKKQLPGEKNARSLAEKKKVLQLKAFRPYWFKKIKGKPRAVASPTLPKRGKEKRISPVGGRARRRAGTVVIRLHILGGNQKRKLLLRKGRS